MTSRVVPREPLDGQLSRILHEMAGAVSMCWNPRPTGVFKSSQAIEFVSAAIAEIRSYVVPAPEPVPDAELDSLVQRLGDSDLMRERDAADVIAALRQQNAELRSELRLQNEANDMLGAERNAATDAIFALRQQIEGESAAAVALGSAVATATKRAKSAERERDELRQLLADIKPHWDANTRGRVWIASTAGVMADLRTRLNAAIAKQAEGK